MKPKALVWFTGVISKFNLSDIEFDNMQFNKNTLSKLQETHDIITIIQVPSQEAKEKYQRIISEANLGDIIYVYIGWYDHVDETLFKLCEMYPDINKYVDYSKQRMHIASKLIKNENIYHISQLLN